ncbi:acetate--CoA ligase family protein [Variovorax sp. PBL-E5]|uniref:acetate--CoA ligase family protein n=1 Tax=Variovorax sp. PBL-E5 TaxID=434014 RepID=UPI0013190E33|nr:acetate--CoA ligase family protein [Variovorax sp. PBL-E5]VTU37567.1 succinyl-CoA synthetase subunit alpha [Variovorax sp. PBL-E5]
MFHPASTDGARVRAFLKPRSIAIIGASADETKIGGRPIRYLRLAGYQGPIYPINPGREVVQGLKSYPTLQAVDAEVDLVVIAVPAQDVLAAVEACAAKGVNGAMVFSSGFAEVDEAGRALQARITEAARKGNVPLLGPNCAGTFNVREGLLATFTSGIIDKPPRIGSIGMVSQSGAFGIHMIVLAAERELGLSMCLTTGNQSDVDLSEALAYVVEDPETEVIVAIIEGVINPPRLLAAFEAARRKRKPVIVLKLGRSEAGARAAASHTASLAGSDEIFDAILRQNNVYRAHSIEELMDVAYACSLKRFPINDKVGLITVSGGVGILMADQAEAAGLQVAELPAESQRVIKELLPFAAARNPVDVTAQVITHPQLIGPMFEQLLTGGGFGSAVCFITHIARNKDLFGKLLPHFEEVARNHADRFLVLSALASPETRKHLEGMGYAVFEDPGRALKAISALVKFRHAFEAAPPETPPAVPSGALAVRHGHTYDEFQAKKMLLSAGIPCAAESLATSAQAAVVEAERIGFPLVMKIVSPDIQHKSEIGGVLLNVRSVQEVREGYATLMDRAETHAPGARIAGVLLAQQVQGGVETILGVMRDPVYGPMVMFGLGGVFVEVLKDVTFRRAPFGPSEARRMIREVKGYAMLQGVRGAPPADEDALVQALTRLSAYAAAQGDALESIDVNPFIVMPKGRGALAVDALIQSN